MTKTLTVDIRLDGIEIDGRLYPYPILLTDLAALFDEEPMEMDASRGARTTARWWWMDSGLSASHKDGVHAFNLKFDVVDPAHDVRIEGRPYGEVFGPRGSTYENHDFGTGFIMANRTNDLGPDQHVERIIVEQKVPRGKKAAARKQPAKPAAPMPDVDGVEFADLNFKLLVLQHLMYDQQLLQPAFDVEEFLERHVDRDVDLDEEGYAPIPEVLDYFRQYPVPRDLLGEVTTLTMDGGNDIYLQIAPRWDGEDEVFDIEDFSDAALLPNLGSLTVGDPDDETLEPLRARGVTIDQL